MGRCGRARVVRIVVRARVHACGRARALTLTLTLTLTQALTLTLLTQVLASLSGIFRDSFANVVECARYP